MNVIFHLLSFTSLNLEADDLCPESYRVNSPDEIRLLAIVENFQLQYSHLCPERKPLLLCPVNECGVKVTTTTIRFNLTRRVCCILSSFFFYDLSRTTACITCLCVIPVYMCLTFRSLCQWLFGPHRQPPLNFSPGRAVPRLWLTSCLWTCWSRLWTWSGSQCLCRDNNLISLCHIHIMLE